MINVKTVVLGPIAVNCYIVTDADTGKTAVIDPGDFDSRIDRILTDAGYENIEYILLTHGHFDHIDGVNHIVEKTGGKAKVAIYKTEEKFLTDDYLNLGIAITGKGCEPVKADVLLSDGDKIKLGNSEFTVMLTPGHTSGSVCYICDNCIFSGDTLFCGAAGRTDFPTSNYDHLMASLQKLAALTGDYVVYPGHNMSTTLNEERRLNPYM